ncbi:HEAT repeat domain-containing protein [Waterburya agarophytonicola K14]|uniref:HEAT repeat domain-containing protein n=1 Tax=Waterburya agarophytonicola KI4 TaxID=2874699 RepID=A0A964BNR4_9CYAN|nr:HEAT repeat domain-containing protein [Waterburya agarophytonicola]MCC0176794.1 HEAT repeat domain-containing protein [Waterburya agarophytonicola KI4]
MRNEEVNALKDTEIHEAEQLTEETAIANLKQKEDLGARYYAAWWLGKFRIKNPAAVSTLLMALEDEQDRAPDGGYPLRRNAARALGKLGDKRAVEPLTRCLEFPDYYVREAAAQALEMLDDHSCIAALIKMLDGGIESATRVPGKPHLVEPYEAVIEALGTLSATEAVEYIEPFTQHPTEKVKYAAARAMYQLTREDKYGEILIRALEGDDLQLRRSALMDLGAVGYIKAGKAIANTLAENSMKLIALKGLLETDLANKNTATSAESIEIMDLMDALL